MSRIGGFVWWSFGVLLGVCLLAAGGAAAAETSGEAVSREDYDALLGRVEALEGGSETSPAPEGEESKVHFFGYGEVHYNSPTGSELPVRSNRDLVDAHRVVLGFGYDWTEKTSFTTEVEFEHGGTAIELEYLHLDHRLSDAIGLRAGVLLMPIGPLNEFHEPTRFYSVERPYNDRVILPTTWQEPGAGIFGRIDGPLPFPIQYRLYAVTNTAATGFSADQGIRGGRGRGRENQTTGVAGVGRLEFSPWNPLSIGVSGYRGTAGQNLGFTSHVSILEADAKLAFGPFEFLGRHNRLRILNATTATARNGTNNDPVAERSVGTLAEADIHLGRWIFGTGSQRDLVAFGRYEWIDTQDKVAAGVTRNRAFDREIAAGGLAFFLTPQVVFKADIEHWKVASGAPSENRYNFGFGYDF